MTAAGLALTLACGSETPAGGDEPPPTPPTPVPVADAGLPPAPPAPTPYEEAPEHLIGDPAALIGGSLLATRGGLLVAADPARDHLYVTDPVGQTVVASIRLDAGAEPGRLVEDGAGRVHVALRQTGELVTLTAALDGIGARRSVCPAPRGLAYDASTDSILVACTGGELVTLPSAGGEPTQRVHVMDDLRDIVLTETHRYVTRFRSAELLTLDAEGQVIERRSPLSATVAAGGEGVDLVPNVAIRTVALADGSLVMLHQRSFSTAVEVDDDEGRSRGGYGGGAVAPPECQTGIVQTSMTHFPAEGTTGLRPGPILSRIAVPLDLAVDGERLTVAGGGTEGTGVVARYAVSSLDARSPTDCIEPLEETGGGVGVVDGGGTVYIQRLEPAAVVRMGATGGDETWTWLDPTRQIASPGFDIFNRVTGTVMACASCHPEGGEDGHTWTIGSVPPRRTQTLRGGIMDTQPFHWGGDQPDLATIMTTTFTGRMGGEVLGAIDVAAVGDWIDGLPSFPAPETDRSLAEEGHEAFTTAGCDSCHSGAKLTDNASVAFGDAEAIQVPMLIGVAHRAPFFSDGCAQELGETFDGSCVPEHVPATPLSDAETVALQAYLRSL
ncbi:MAG: cytochrome-c peroxidase [Sandaracinus sp.]|nr:cytochrome-c peroxidase [Sandaracinus sp.]